MTRDAPDAPGPPDALIVVDADGQHPPDRIPEFVEASAEFDVVIGDRRGDREAMPWTRRCTNAVSSALLTLVTGRRMLDSQCGMRLYRAEALERAPLPPGRYEAETRHLRAALRAGLAVGWVPIPAIYDGEKSAFRPVRDTWRVLGSILGPNRRRVRVLGPNAEFARRWAIRFALLVAGTLGLGAVMPLLQPLDERLFLEVNALGAGPEWLRDALDPHTRNYILLCLAATIGAGFYGRRAAIGAALATTIAALWSDVLVQLVYMLYVRDRPEEVLGAQALLGRGRPLGAHRVVPQRPHGRHDGDRRRRDRGGPVAARAVLDLLRGDRPDPDHVRRALPARRRRGDGVRLPGRPVRVGAGLPLRARGAPARTALGRRTSAGSGDAPALVHRMDEQVHTDRAAALRVDEVAARDHRDGLGGDLLDLRLDARELLVGEHRRALERQLAL